MTSIYSHIKDNISIYGITSVISILELIVLTIDKLNTLLGAT